MKQILLSLMAAFLLALSVAGCGGGPAMQIADDLEVKLAPIEDITVMMLTSERRGLSERRAQRASQSVSPPTLRNGARRGGESWAWALRAG